MRESGVRQAESIRADAAPAIDASASLAMGVSGTDWRSTVELRLPFAARVSIESQQLEHLAPEDA